jgi:hypothetical protein
MMQMRERARASEKQAIEKGGKEVYHLSGITLCRE